MSRIIVERNFDTSQSDADMAKVADRERPCLEVYKVQWKRSLLSTDRKRMVCEYDAADAETVRKVQREAQAMFDRIWVADVIE
ncbi:nickel-binding protein [Undibacterium sp.]|uniref:nickel-binding protein n=1 Tax=Undibacterium sp. TaxID=1914977 RepID=UPI002CEB7A69|nr:nickel-binding protein [Undibacterium sp.]HTD05323.1 nickel-binding protein [Undibacterium sp.]